MTYQVLNYLKETKYKIKDNLIIDFISLVIWRNSWCKNTNIKNSKMLGPVQEQCTKH